MRFLKSQNQIYFINNFKIYLVEPTQLINFYTVKDDKVFIESKECVLTEISNTYTTYRVIYDNLNDGDLIESVIVDGKEIYIMHEYMTQSEVRISENATVIKVYEEIIKNQSEPKIVILQNGFGFCRMDNKWFQIFTIETHKIFTDKKDFKFLDDKLFYNTNECVLVEIDYHQWSAAINRSLSAYYEKMIVPLREFYELNYSRIYVKIENTHNLSIEIKACSDCNTLLLAHNKILNIIQKEYELKQNLKRIPGYYSKIEHIPLYDPSSKKIDTYNQLTKKPIEPKLKQMPKIPYFIETDFDGPLYIPTTTEAPFPDANTAD